MNTFIFIRRRISARFFALITIVSLILSAFPVAFFVAEAARVGVDVIAVNTSTVATNVGVHLRAVVQNDSDVDKPTAKIILTDNSAGGEFSGADEDGCKGSFVGAPKEFTISSNKSNKNFCYKNLVAGVYEVKVELYVNEVKIGDDTIQITVEEENLLEEKKVDICHWNGNFYIPQSVALNSIGSGHGSSGVNMGDIVPPTPDFPEGFNWDWGHSWWKNKCVKPEPETVTLHADKIVCDNESLLPNWNNTEGGAPNITETTVAEFLASTPERTAGCHLEPGWSFEWAPEGTTNPGDTLIGTAGEDWTTFTGSTEVPEDVFDGKDSFWVREVLRENYIPFTFGQEGDKNTDNYSAEMYCHTDGFNYDNRDRVDSPKVDNEYYCVAWNVPIEQNSTVTMCKYDEEQNPLSGWTLMLLGDEVDSVEVPVNTGFGTDTSELTGGVSYVAVSEGTWDNNRTPLNVVDTEYSTEDGWLTHMDGFTGYGTDILELFINGNPDPASNWGSYNSGHRYAQTFIPDTDGTVNLSINDTYYGDNTGSLNVTIYEGYIGITGDDGCVTFEDVPFGDYVSDEIQQDNWESVSGLGGVSVNSETEIFEVVNRNIEETPVATIIAEKIVCDNESLLPNWNNTEEGAPNITETTVAEFLASTPERTAGCHLEPGWSFEWASQNTDNPDNNLPTNPFFGEAGEGWVTFGPTGSDGKAIGYLTAEDIGDDSYVWVREVLQDNYIPFSFGPNHQTNENDVTAELYCHYDGVNYDNFDSVTAISVDNTYHCVAWNVHEPIDVCSNLDGIQEVLPEGYEFVDEGICELIDNEVLGCTDPEAINYNPEATLVNADADACEYAVQERSRSYSSGTKVKKPVPQVLGASTDSFCPLIKDHMQMGWDNDPFEVMKLQLFLNMFKNIYEGVENPVDGVFGTVTDANVKAFQKYYQNDILDPWYVHGIVPSSEPTGFVYKTTKWKINSIVCPNYEAYPSFEGEDLTQNIDLD